MNVYAEVEIRSQRGTAHIIDALRQFSLDRPEWAFDEDQTSSYLELFPDRVGCAILCKGNNWDLKIGICEERQGYCRIANIVPIRIGSIPNAEYNEIARRFHDQVKQWSRQKGKAMRLTISKINLNLQDILTAKKPLEYFEAFLGNHPLSGHPCDISRLDQFICAVSRYSRKTINWEYLGQYLREKEGWPDDSVEWCLERIRTGLEIIVEYKKFH